MQLAEKKNNHVERLNRYLPLTPTMDQVYDEYTSTNDSINLKTVAEDYLTVAAKSGARLIILTGDAGHGKTHLCRRLIQNHLGYNEEEARELINLKCDGNFCIKPKDEDEKIIPLKIYKDLSELIVSEAVKRIEKASESVNEITVVCANEGLLRKVLESPNASPLCKKILKEFSESFENGLVSSDGRDHIINLNYQSVASEDNQSLIANALKEWSSGTRWNVCQKCISHTKCPIYHNRNLLTDEEKGESRRSKVEQIFATSERLGSIITIREMLMSLAYIITGGLDCIKVHQRIKKQPDGWQPVFSFYNLLFEAPDQKLEEKLSKIPILKEIARLDPGKKSLRLVDDRILNKQDQFPTGNIDLIFVKGAKSQQELIDTAKGIDDVIGNPSSRNEQQKEAEFVVNIVRSLRRRSFCDDDLSPKALMERLGFENGGVFLDIIGGDVSPAEMTKLKKKVISGLHRIQGLHMESGETNLHLVDPAFGNATSHAAIIASIIPSPSVKLLPMKEKWSIQEDHENHMMAKSVDWINRHIVLRIKEGNNKYNDFPLNLVTFNCVARAANGYVARDFYAHDLRKITTFLGRIAERSKKSGDAISLFIDGRVRSVSIDDGVIQIGGGGQ